MPSKRFLFSLVSTSLVSTPFLLVALSLLPAASAHAQAYTQIVIIGDSLTDVGNDTAASAALYGPSLSVPSPGTGYTQGRFTDGTDTLPPAVNYRGVWAEQLALMLPNKPIIKNSLAGGTDYAYGFAFTGSGTTAFTYGPNNVLSFNIQNMGLQLSTYLATNPTINANTLFIVWGGANDLLNATSTAAIVTAATNETAIVQQLIAAGATNILVPNLPPLGLIPRLNGTPGTALAATQASAGFNQALAAGLAQLISGYPLVHIYQLDTYTLFNTLVGPPLAKGLANVTASSQGLAVNPDTYLFWDGLHPTTFGHSLLASTAFTLLGPPVTTSTVVASSNVAANLASAVTLTASVTGTGTATPMGTLTFLDGTTVLSSSVVTGTTTTATASYTTSTFTAGTHTITAKFVGVNGYGSSASAAVSEVVTAPALTLALSPSTLTVTSGLPGTSILTLNPVGGYSGTGTLACGPLPAAHFSCNISVPTLVLNGSNTQLTDDIIIGTGAASFLQFPHRPGSSNLPEVISAFAFLPFLGIAGLAAIGRRRTGLQNLTLLLFLTLGSAGAVIGLSGCSNGPAGATPGTYTIPITLTINGTTNVQTVTIVVQ